VLYSSLRIIENDHVPRMSHVGDEIKPIWPHPLAALFEYLFTGRVTPVMYVCGKKIEEPCAWMVDGTLFIHTEWARHLLFKDPRSVVNVSNIC